MAHHRKLSSEERSVLAALKAEGLSLRQIATKMRRSVSTISDELKRNADGNGYDPSVAQFQTHMRRWEANRRNPLKSERLRQYVEEKLQEGWSPELISGRLAEEFPRDVTMRVSHETIYQWLYEERRSDLLPRGTPRRERRRYRLTKAKGTQGLGDVTGIEKRPKRADARSQCGHWEGDTMLGKKERGPAVAVELDRKTRYVVLTKIRVKTAAAMKRAITRHLTSLPPMLRRSLTLDRGSENAEHHSFGVPVYFCDPYSSWQKGSVEQVIGLIRRYIPKGTDLRTITPTQLKIIQDRLNHRPRKVLGFKTPHEVFSAYCKTLGVRI